MGWDGQFENGPDNEALADRVVENLGEKLDKIIELLTWLQLHMRQRK